MPKTVPVPTDAAPTASGRPPVEAERPPLGHLRGLDGLRAIAVLAVVLYHAGLGWLSGGFLGVEVFFVISGYLITALLLAEHRATGRIDPIRFWVRRARRLLPALFLLLVATLAVAVLVVPGEVARLRSDALAAVVYVTNWNLILADQSYFETIGRPSLFLHLWSLAIEEQFYVLWPVVLAAMLLAGRRVAVVVALLGAAGSAAWMALQFDPAADPSRIYYGTDTRLTGLLLGSALAFIWVPAVSVVTPPGRDMSRRKRRRLVRQADAAGHWASGRLGWALDVVAVAAVCAVIVLFAAADAYEPFLYQGGFAALAGATVVLIAAVVHPRGHVGRLLELGPIRWVGTRSYSIYLWHWPIFALTRPQLDLPLDALPTLAVRLLLTAVAAECSYRFVETPIRRGSLGRAWARLRSAEPSGGRRYRRWSAPATAGGFAAVLSVLLVSVAIATPPPLPDGLLTASIDGVVVAPLTGSLDPATQLGSTSAPSQASGAPGASRPAPDRSAAPDRSDAPGAAGATAGPTLSATPSMAPTPSPVASAAPSPTPTPEPGILAFGESVMIQGAEELAEDLGPVRVDAAVGRHVNEGVEILQERAADGDLPGTVVVQLGNNGPFRAGEFDAAMDALQDVPLVVWVNVRVPRDWEAHNNRIIESGVARYPNARLVDWYAATADRPDLFWDDGYHPRPEGAKLYADLIAETVSDAEAVPQ
jgi:peptidoglycan/LPS O-acetylase OafA/YrhL